jgi:hypothetical protein
MCFLTKISFLLWPRFVLDFKGGTTITYSDDSFQVKILCNNYIFYCDTLKFKKKKKKKKKKKVSGLTRFGYRLIAFEPAQSIQRIRVRG